jgi:hypothetical protein
MWKMCDMDEGLYGPSPANASESDLVLIVAGLSGTINC